MIKNISDLGSTHHTCHSISRYSPHKNENICPHKHVYMNVHNSPKLETTEIFINLFKDKYIKV